MSILPLSPLLCPEAKVSDEGIRKLLGLVRELRDANEAWDEALQGCDDAEEEACLVALEKLCAAYDAWAEPQ